LDNQGDEPQFDELYRDLILDHYRSPRNRGVIVEPDVDLIQHNPVCGDEIRLTAKIVDGRVSSIEFTGQGCSISQASASMLTDMVTGRDIEEPNERLMEDLMALKGVSKYPVRVKCAVLAWDTLQKALEL
jgi:nitrogen fixation NifU-like protein